MKKKVILFSGGVDSFCMAHIVDADILVYFDLGLPENEREIEHMKQLDISRKLVIDTRFKLADQKLPNEVLPFRNLFLITGAFYYGTEVYLGATSSSTNLDKNETFAGKLLDVMQYISADPNKNPAHITDNQEMSIEMPFKTKTKSQFVGEYLKQGHSVSELLKTRSCYAGDEVECGKCQSCVRKFMAFINNDLPTEFTSDPGELLEAQFDRVVAIEQLDVADEVLYCARKLNQSWAEFITT